MAEPSVPPPDYATATGLSTSSKPSHDTSHLQIPQGRNGIPAQSRRSMEDEHRPLPHGWVRQYDAKEGHQFFVDTLAKPPRSIWTHPYDDQKYLGTLSSAERERIEEEEHERIHPDLDKMSAVSTEGASAPLPPRPSASEGSKKKEGFGSKLKDKITGMTKEERRQLRVQREEEERQYYEAHQAFRIAMQKAQMTGEPQFLAKDKDGRDVYIEPPQGPGQGYGSYGDRGGYGYNPYSSGPYSDPNAKFIRPQQQYARPYGGGYGGGYGMPMMGGMMGGMLLGGLLF